MKKKNSACKNKTTTIAIPIKVKERIQEYGLKGESYAEIIERLLESARKRMISDVLMDDKDCIPIEQALAEAKKRWPK
ncbi:MAG: DUF7557 family protein [Nanoarchaeota archaeon]